MVKISAAVIGGVILGIIVMLGTSRFESGGEHTRQNVVRDIADSPKLPPAIAARHRDELYRELTNVEDIASLPTEFARMEAMHVLAGRSDRAELRHLIDQTDRIADDIERVSLQRILIFRLTEIEPQAALELARSDRLKSFKVIEQTVWRAWAHNNLDDALFAAKVQISIADKNAAAQGLYAAFGYMGNKYTDRIEAELDIGPDRSSRGRYLYHLADISPAEAIHFINMLPSGDKQEQYVSWLAYYISLRDPADALKHADLFVVAANGEHYKGIINREIARDDPYATMERLLAKDGVARMSGELHSAFRALAATDTEAAMRYFEQARSDESRRMFGGVIVSQLARTDPTGAIAWARANDSGQFLYLQMSVLGQIARSDPQLAFTAALNTPRSEMRSHIISTVVKNIARNDPTAAIAYLDQIPDQKQKLDASRQLVSSWMRTDPDAAFDWVLSQDKDAGGILTQMAVMTLMNHNPDAAMRILPRVDKQTQVGLRQQIVQVLATRHSLEEAQSFIQQFDGQPDYGQLQASLVSGVARTDPLQAKLMADQLAVGNARDRAYVQVITRHAMTDPVEAARWITSIGSASMRAAATGQLAAQWYTRDPLATEHWIDGLPTGPSRDDAIMQMSFHWQDSTVAQEKLIASIEDRDKRGQAKIRQIYHIMRSDSARARKLLQDPDISDLQRQQIEMAIGQLYSRF